jgi:chromosome partitioning protein
MKKRSKIFSIANQKGGVCKTTAAITLAQYFAAVERKKVLIIDLDAQGNASHGLGIQKPTDAVYSILVKGTDIPAVLLSAREHLDIVTSGPKRTADSLAISLMTEYQQNAKFALSLAFNNFIEENGYDYVFIDTPPAAGLLQMSAVIMSDYIICPIVPKLFALEGLSEMLATYATIVRMPDLETPPVFFGVLMSMYDRTKNVTQRMLSRSIKMLGGDASRILPPIPTDVKVEEGYERGQTIFEYAPNSPAAIGYENGSVAVHNSAGRVGGYLHIADIIKAL